MRIMLGLCLSDFKRPAFLRPWLADGTMVWVRSPRHRPQKRWHLEEFKLFLFFSLSLPFKTKYVPSPTTVASQPFGIVN
jgi:hypothetical protein